MPRQKAFDPDVALQSAMDLFWEKGYEATSVQDLVDRMGINRFSMYDTFGGKHELFLAALEKYKRERAGELIGELRNSPDGLSSIENYFSKVVDYLSSPHGERACFVVNSTVELAAEDADIAGSCKANLDDLQRAFSGALKRARKRGEIGSETDVQATAQYLLTSMLGLNVMAKHHPKREDLEKNVELILSVLT